MKALVVIDYQNDFVNGALACGVDAENIEGFIVGKIKEYKSMFVNENGASGRHNVYMTLDTHNHMYESSVEGALYPKHCVKYTEGWLPYNELKRYIDDVNVKVIQKDQFGSIELVNMLKADSVSEVDVVGIATNVCVFHNVVMIYNMLPKVKINVFAQGCASFERKLHDQALSFIGGFANVIH